MKKILSIAISIIILLQGTSLAAVLASEAEEQPGYDDGCYTTAHAPQPGELLINEFLSRPSKGQQEWIEIYNPTDKTITGSCELQDRVGSIHIFSELRISPKHHLLHQLARNKLNNGGDIIKLLCQDELIDQVEYGTEALPEPKVDQSLARSSDGAQQWLRFGDPTPDAPNKANDLPTPPESPQAYNQSGWDLIFLSTVLPNPDGKDSDGGEFIELINLGQQDVNLSDWNIVNNKDKTIAALSGLISSKSTLHILPTTAIKNTTETLQLLDPLGVVRDQLSYDQSIKVDQRWLRDLHNFSWHLESRPKPPKPLYTIIEPPSSPLPLPQAPFRVQQGGLIPTAHAAGNSSAVTSQKPLQLLAIVLVLALMSLRQIHSSSAPGVAAKNSSSRHPQSF